MQDKHNLSPDYVQVWANKIKQMGLAQPAILLLEAHKPLSFTISQVVLLGQPIVDLFIPTQFTHNVINLFSNRVYLDGFIQALERE